MGSSDVAVETCGCGCGTVSVGESAAHNTCSCGCGSADTTPKTKEDEIAELQALRATIDSRLASLAG